MSLIIGKSRIRAKKAGRLLGLCQLWQCAMQTSLPERTCCKECRMLADNCQSESAPASRVQHFLPGSPLPMSLSSRKPPLPAQLLYSYLALKSVSYLLLSDKSEFKFHTSSCVWHWPCYLGLSLLAHKIGMITLISVLLGGLKQIIYVKTCNMVSDKKNAISK